MAGPQLDEETLMSYVDGALDDDAARAVGAAAKADEDVAATIAALRRTSEVSREALRSLLNEPVPAELSATVRAFAARHPAIAEQDVFGKAGGDGANLVPLRPRARPIDWRGAGIGMGLAASLTLVVGYGAGLYSAGQGNEVASPVETAQLDQRGLVEALYEILSGETMTLPGGEAFRAIATFPVDGGTLCREFEVNGTAGDAVVAVACHTDGSWHTRFMVATQATGDTYAPAASLEVVHSYLSIVAAGDTLAETDEAAALSGLR